MSDPNSRGSAGERWGRPQTRPPEPVRPDYGGAWNGAILPSLLVGQPAAWLPDCVRTARSVVLLVVDGLGWHALERWPERAATLGGLAGVPITTCAPTSTTAALTSIATGLTPSEHGVVGYRMRVGGEILNVLKWETASGDPGPEPAAVQPHAPFAGRDLRLVTRSEFRDSGFSTAHLRGGTMVGWRTTAVLAEHVRRLVASREPVIYAYYDGVDKVAHEYGLDNGFFEMEVAFVDGLVTELLDTLPGDAALLVTSDHGQVQVHDKIGLEEIAGLVAAYSGEARFRSLFARHGAGAELLAACRAAFGDRAWVFTRDQLFDEGWLGDGASHVVRGRIGDVVLAAHAPVAFIAPDHEVESKLVAFHGSLTPDEVHVPLLAARGRA